MNSTWLNQGFLIIERVFMGDSLVGSRSQKNPPGLVFGARRVFVVRWMLRSYTPGPDHVIAWQRVILTVKSFVRIVDLFMSEEARLVKPPAADRCLSSRSAR